MFTFASSKTKIKKSKIMTTPYTKNNMMVYHADWNETKTFKLLPITPDCPFNEVIYDPEQKILAIISKDTKEKPVMLPKLDDKGDTIIRKIPSKTSNNAFLQERRIVPMYFEYYITDKEDIKEFIKIFSVNLDHTALTILDN